MAAVGEELTQVVDALGFDQVSAVTPCPTPCAATTSAPPARAAAWPHAHLKRAHGICAPQEFQLSPGQASFLKDLCKELGYNYADEASALTSGEEASERLDQLLAERKTKRAAGEVSRARASAECGGNA